MAYWDNGPLKVGENKRYLTNGDKPFFWMGDTAWLFFQQSTMDEAYVYLKNRSEKGFNVISSVLIHSMPGGSGSSLASIELDVTRREYWEHCRSVVKLAEELNIYMALLPTWGSLVKEGILTEDNVCVYADFLSEQFGSCPNVIWILGGDIRGCVAPGLYRKFGTRLKELMPDKLIGFHPFGRTASSLWFNDEKWLDFNMFQSGHRRYDQKDLKAWDDGSEEFFGEDNWRYVRRDHANTVKKPTMDAEPSYELIPQGLHDPSEPYWQAWHVRRYAYWSVFEGAMGHIYGDNGVQQFFNGKNGSGNYGVLATWYESIHHEGSSHMKHLTELMNSVDFINGLPAEERLISGQGEREERISIFAGADYLLAYDYTGREFSVDISGLSISRKYVYWFDPVSGVYSFYMDATGMDQIAVKPVKKTSGQNDWVLVIRGY